MNKEQLLIELKEVLLRGIPETVKKIKLEEGDKVCYISLLGTDDESILGLITLGIESYRNTMIEESGTDDKWYLWNSGEMPTDYQAGIEDEDPTFSMKQEAFRSLFEDDDWELHWEACQTLRFEVANRLNQYNWNEIIPITDDFVVYSDWGAIDVVNGDLARSLPQDKLELLTQRDLI